MNSINNFSAAAQNKQVSQKQHGRALQHLNTQPTQRGSSRGPERRRLRRVSSAVPLPLHPGPACHGGRRARFCERHENFSLKELTEGLLEEKTPQRKAVLKTA